MGGGGTLVTRYWGGRGGAQDSFLLTLYNFKNIGGGGGHVPESPGSPCSAVTGRESMRIDKRRSAKCERLSSTLMIIEI